MVSLTPPICHLPWNLTILRNRQWSDFSLFLQITWKDPSLDSRNLYFVRLSNRTHVTPGTRRRKYPETMFLFLFHVSFIYGEANGDTPAYCAQIFTFEDRTKTAVVVERERRFCSRHVLVSLWVSPRRRQQLIVSVSRYVDHPSPRINYVTAAAVAAAYAATSPRATLPALLIILPSFLPSFRRRPFIFTFSFSCVALRSHSALSPLFTRFPTVFQTSTRSRVRCSRQRVWNTTTRCWLDSTR